MSNPVTAVNSFRTVPLRATITRPANTTEYSAGDAISNADDAGLVFGELNAPNQVGDQKKAGRPGWFSGSINALHLHSSANQSTKLFGTLFLFYADIGSTADNAEFAPTDAQMLNLAAIIDIPASAWVAGNSAAGAGGNAVAQITNINLPYRTSGGGQLFGRLIARNAYAPVSGEVFTCDLVLTLD